jgi:hypothetical protein
MCFCQVPNNNRLYLVQVPVPNQVIFHLSSLHSKISALEFVTNVLVNNFIEMASDSGSDY